MYDEIQTAAVTIISYNHCMSDLNFNLLGTQDSMTVGSPLSLQDKSMTYPCNNIFGTVPPVSGQLAAIFCIELVLMEY